MEVLTVYIGYLWVAGIHCVFVGCTCYLLLGHRLMRQRQITVVFLFSMFLALLEVYWIHVFSYWNVIVFSRNEGIIKAFGLEANTNILEVLRPGLFQVFIWLASGYLANLIGRTGYRRLQKRKV